MLECLQRALRVADSCMESATSVELFVEILDRYVYYFDQANESVRPKRKKKGISHNDERLAPACVCSIYPCCAAPAGR